jgi:menaquinone-dependent protoporphyrinogen oxidase
MSSILLAYSTTDGHTAHICERLRQVIEEQGHNCKVVLLTQADALDLASFDSIVIGASIRYGKHQPAVTQFIGRHQALLERKANAFFSVNIVARKPEKNRPDTNPYLLKFLRQISWKPKLLGVFAGKLDYPRYRFFDRLMIRFIMLITSGPTDPKAVIEFTDWKEVEAFGRQLAKAV